MAHKCHSPRGNAIHTINTLLNNRYQPFLHGANRKATLIQKSLAKEGSTALASFEAPVSNNIHEHQPPLSTENVQLIMNKLSRSMKSYYTPLQQYQRLHFNCLHMSDSMLKEMIRRGIKGDMPKKLFQDV